MATSDENPFWSDPDLRKTFFDLDPARRRHRRFFDVDTLAGFAYEDAEVFDVTHAKVLELVRDGLVEGLRIDHPDGLANPREYLERLRERGVAHVWIEKILEPGEQLRAWPVEGTTGYEFANDVTAVFVDPRGEAPLTELYAELTGERRTFAEIAHEAKLEVARTTFAPEFAQLRALDDDPRLEEAAAAMHVYRTYVEPEAGRVDDADRLVAGVLHDELRRIVLLEGERSPELDEFVVRWQQTTGPVLAKGVEDTAFYRYFRLTALNEVGGDPGRFSIGPDELHAAALERFARHPLQLLASQTHDTKRAGDVRARIGALAGMPERWGERVRRWRELTGGLEDRTRYLVWQTLVGAWPTCLRGSSSISKALREQRTTNWVDPTSTTEARATFVRSLHETRAFLDDFEPFAADVIVPASTRRSARSCAPHLAGLPDIYQGDAFWSLNLVDPTTGGRRLEARLPRGGTDAPRRETTKFHLIRRPSGSGRSFRSGLAPTTARSRARQGRLRAGRQDPCGGAASS